MDEQPAAPKPGSASKLALYHDAILEALAHGQSKRGACRLVGLDHETLLRWIRRYPAFAREVDQATSRAAEWAVDAVRRACTEAEIIETFGRDGQVIRRVTKFDWRAAAWFLEHHPDMRVDWKPAPTELAGPEGQPLVAPAVSFAPGAAWMAEYARVAREMAPDDDSDAEGADGGDESDEDRTGSGLRPVPAL